MYLLTFVLLIISILGVYTQVYALQAAKMFQGQKVIGKTIQTWHTAAYGLAMSDATMTDCYLTAGLAPTCTLTLSEATTADTPDEVRRKLPVGYPMGTYNWSSYLYTDSGMRYLITFASPSGGPATPIARPAIGYTVGEVYKQITNNRPSPNIYGTVMNGKLTTQNGKREYNVPGGIVANGSIGFVSPL